MEDETCTEVYLLHVWICRISPMIWRRLLVRSDSTIAELHYTLQTAFGKCNLLSPRLYDCA
jgi:Plasmid pRiA4b ORF-3-like protein